MHYQTTRKPQVTGEAIRRDKSGAIADATHGIRSVAKKPRPKAAMRLSEAECLLMVADMKGGGSHEAIIVILVLTVLIVILVVIITSNTSNSSE